MYFECKIKTEKISQQDAAPKFVSESYLVDAMTFAEAEMRVMAEQAPYASGPIEVTACKKVKLTGIVESDNPQADKYFKIKVMFVNYDEEKQTEKRVANYFYVHATTLFDAVKVFQEVEMKNWQVDYEVSSVSDTPIMDIYRFSADAPKPQADKDSSAEGEKKKLTSEAGGASSAAVNLMSSSVNRSLVIPADTYAATPAQESEAEGDTIADRLCAIRQTLPEHVQLVCVSKYKSRQQIMEAYQAGERLFAESRVQELVDKAATLPDDIQWHFIGHLQTNKVRQVLPVVSLIQSVDSEHLLQKISDEAVRLGKQVDVLLEVHVAQEQTKTGFSIDEVRELLSTVKVYNSTGFLTAFPSVRVRGLMCMASNTDDMEQVAAEFARVSDLAHEVFDDPILSMGMSEDYLVAIEQGSNMVRIGSAIFGER